VIKLKSMMLPDPRRSRIKKVEHPLRLLKPVDGGEADVPLAGKRSPGEKKGLRWLDESDLRGRKTEVGLPSPVVKKGPTERKGRKIRGEKATTTAGQWPGGPRWRSGSEKVREWGISPIRQEQRVEKKGRCNGPFKHESKKRRES